MTFSQRAVEAAAPPRTVSSPPHLADGKIMHVPVIQGGHMSVPDPRSYGDGGIVWHLTWGDHTGVKYTAASIIVSYASLLSADIPQYEAVRRLKLLRQAYIAAQQEPTNASD